MGSINIGEVSKGTKLLFDNVPWVVLEVNFVKPGKGNAFYKTRVQNLLNGNVLEKTLRGGEKCDTADVEDRLMNFLYADGNGFVFMDQTNFEQLSVTKEAVGDDKDFLLENMEVNVTLFNGQPIAIKLPNTVHMEVIYTEPAIKGDTQSRVMKPAKLNTGAEIKVPIFVAIGDKIAINTQTREYQGRVDRGFAGACGGLAPAAGWRLRRATGGGEEGRAAEERGADPFRFRSTASPLSCSPFESPLLLFVLNACSVALLSNLPSSPPPVRSCMINWRPTAAVESLRVRAERLDALRGYFRAQGVLEVDVPILQPGANLDPGVEPVRVETSEGPRWIPTSPEHPLKRLVAAGYGAVWAYAPCVRSGERGRRHLPEFRMVEWYRPGWGLDQILNDTVAVLALLTGFSGAVQRLPWAEGYQRYAGCAPESVGALYPDLPLDAAQDLCWAERIEPHLGRGCWTAVTEWPVARAAQARIVTGSAGSPVAARFEIIRDGIELANGYDECPDASELERRMTEESAQRPDRPAVDLHLIAALAAGFPPCSGVAVGFDRCIRLRLGLDNIAGTMAFARG